MKTKHRTGVFLSGFLFCTFASPSFTWYHLALLASALTRAIPCPVGTQLPGGFVSLQWACLLQGAFVCPTPKHTCIITVMLSEGHYFELSVLTLKQP